MRLSEVERGDGVVNRLLIRIISMALGMGSNGGVDPGGYVWSERLEHLTT